MAKYKWWKHKKQDAFSRFVGPAGINAVFRQEYLAEFPDVSVRPSGYSDRVEETFTDINTRLVANEIENSLREQFESYIGHSPSIEQLAAEARHTLQRFEHQGLITERYTASPGRSSSEVTVRVQPVHSPDHIAIDIQLE